MQFPKLWYLLDCCSRVERGERAEVSQLHFSILLYPTNKSKDLDQLPQHAGGHVHGSLPTRGSRYCDLINQMIEIRGPSMLAGTLTEVCLPVDFIVWFDIVYELWKCEGCETFQPDAPASFRMGPYFKLK